MLRRVAALCVAALAFALPDSGMAQDVDAIDTRAPVLFSADEIEFDRERGIVTARGNVEFAQNNRILQADEVRFDQRANIVTATGNVALIEPTGEVMFSNYAELTGDLRDGLVANLRMLLADDARMAANVARRLDGDTTILDRAVYSPCAPCADDPEAPLLWQVRARQVVHDQAGQVVRYRDAVLEFLGVPIAYTPYLEHPDPTVDRKSGFLAPRFGNSSERGAFLRVPYYIVIDEQSDLTIEPYYASQYGLILVGDFRHRFAFGELELAGSGAYIERPEDDGSRGDDTFRGHLDATGRYNIDETWRAGHDIRLSSDDTYRRRFGFPDETILTSNAYVEGFEHRSYAAVNAFAFRDTRTTGGGDVPLVLPLAEVSWISDPDSIGSYFQIDGLARTILRERDGTDDHRLSVTAGWHLPYVAPAGDVYHLAATVQGDLYYVNNGVDRDTGEAFNSDVVGRVFPQLSLEWRYPFVRNDGDTQLLIEPILGLVLAPNGGNPGRIPNEDSLDFELDDTNVFAPSRLPGSDIVEGGQRFNYGINLALLDVEGASSSLFLGQSFRFRRDASFGEASGIEDQFSDIVGRLDLAPIEDFRLFDRFRIDKDNFSLVRHEVGLSVGPPMLRLDADYVFLDAGTGGEVFDEREEINLLLSSQFTDYWSAAIGIRRDLAENETRSAGLQIRYEDECFIFATSFTRSFYDDREIEPDDTISFQIMFKTLGGLQL